jgi:predicted deacylase
MVLYHVRPGDNVKKGAGLATIVTRPGDVLGDILLTAPQAGRILTRRCQRFLRRGDDVLKLLGANPSATAKAGPLEA